MNINIYTTRGELHMAVFGYQAIKKMTPRPGTRFATDYYKQSLQERRQLQQHIDWVREEMLLAACRTLQVPELERPMRGFPRTNNLDNYSAFDVMNDIREQLQAGRDLPSGMLGRWQRLFQDEPDYQIEMHLDRPKTPAANHLFQAA